MNTHRRFPLVFGILTTIVLAACGGGTATPSGPGGPAATSGGSATHRPGGAATQAPGGGETVDACALLRAADIKDVTGLELKSTTIAAQNGVFANGCEWELLNDDVMVAPSVILGIQATGGSDYFDRYFAPFEDELDYEPIEGLGDKAFDAGAGAVLVLSGDALFEMQYIAIREDDVVNATALARKVLANLGH